MCQHAMLRKGDDGKPPSVTLEEIRWVLPPRRRAVGYDGGGRERLFRLHRTDLGRIRRMPCLGICATQKRVTIWITCPIRTTNRCGRRFYQQASKDSLSQACGAIIRFPRNQKHYCATVCHHSHGFGRSEIRLYSHPQPKVDQDGQVR